jgi:hypothetical protein
MNPMRKNMNNQVKDDYIKMTRTGNRSSAHQKTAVMAVFQYNTADIFQAGKRAAPANP